MPFCGKCMENPAFGDKGLRLRLGQTFSRRPLADTAANWKIIQCRLLFQTRHTLWWLLPVEESSTISRMKTIFTKVQAIVTCSSPTPAEGCDFTNWTLNTAEATPTQRSPAPQTSRYSAWKARAISWFYGCATSKTLLSMDTEAMRQHFRWQTSTQLDTLSTHRRCSASKTRKTRVLFISTTMVALKEGARRSAPARAMILICGACCWTLVAMCPHRPWTGLSSTWSTNCNTKTVFTIGISGAPLHVCEGVWQHKSRVALRHWCPSSVVLNIIKTHFVLFLFSLFGPVAPFLVRASGMMLHDKECTFQILAPCEDNYTCTCTPFLQWDDVQLKKRTHS